MQWEKGPIHKHPPSFQVLEFKPNEKHNMWTYGSVGMSCEKHARPIELHMFSPYQTDRIVELLTIVASFHYNDEKLGLNHRINFGEPWLEASKCTKGFISLPYLDGPKLEVFCLKEVHVGFYWLIPITEAEADIVDAEGVEGLESRFEKQQFDYLNPNRIGVV
jgi:hypothetical protein